MAPSVEAHDTLAADGRIARIRPVDPQDAAALRALFGSLVMLGLGGLRTGRRSR